MLDNGLLKLFSSYVSVFWRRFGVRLGILSDISPVYPRLAVEERCFSNLDVGELSRESFKEESLIWATLTISVYFFLLLLLDFVSTLDLTSLGIQFSL